MTYTRCSKE